MRQSFHSARILRWMRKPLISIVSAGTMLFFYPMHGFSTPTDGMVVQGQAAITQSGTSTIIDQGSARAVIDWRSFNINANELVRFNQLNQSSVALNRITGGDPTAILGQLSANGRVFLVNPNGILFGQGSKIDVSGLIASTLSINADDFMAGKNLFTQDLSKANSFIVNQGDIRIADNGFCFLVAPGVKNEGTILAQLGKVVMASGNALTLDFNGDGLLTYTLSGKVLDNVIGPDGKPFDTAVSNTGKVSANGGDIVMVGNAGKDVFSSVVNNSGVLEATSLSVKGGSVTLSGGDEGTVKNSGTINVSSIEALAKGGTVSVTGATVVHDGTIHADAIDGDGGTIDIISTESTTLGNGSLTTANAGLNGDGGNIMVWSDVNTMFTGAIEAKGGMLSGNGGFAEVSGKNLGFNGRVDLLAPYGIAGTLLLDPASIVIYNGSGTNDSGGTYIYEQNLESVAAAIVLQADGDITINDIIDNHLTLSSCTGLTIQANWDHATSGNFSMNTGDTISVGGPITIYGANITTGALTSTSGGISLYTHTSDTAATPYINVYGAVSTGGYAFTVSFDNSNSTASVRPSFSNSGGTITTSGGSVNITASSIAANAAINAVAGVVNLTSTGSITGSGLITGSTLNLVTTGSGATIGTSGSKIAINATSVLNASTVNGEIGLSDTADGVAVGLVNAGSGIVSLTSVGSITDAGTNGGADIIGSTLNLVTTSSGSTIGTSSSRLQINATTLTASTTNGEIGLNDTAGGVAVGTINAGTGAVSLTATSGAITSSSSSITAGALTLSGTTIGASGTNINTTVSSINATATTSGGIYIAETNALTSLTAKSYDGDVNIAYNDGSARTLSFTASSDLLNTTGAASINFENSYGGIAVGLVDAGTGNVSLTATGGSITESGSDAAADIVGSSINLITTGSGTVGTSSETLELNATTLNVTTGGGNVYLNDTAGGVQIGSINLTTTGALYLTATGAASSSIASITADGSSNNITAGSATLTTAGVYGGAIGVSGTPIKTTIEGLTASTNSGGIYVTELNGLIISSVIARESTNFGTDAGLDPSVNLSTGKVTLGNTSTAGTFDVTIVAGGSLLLNNEVKAPRTATITATGSIVDNNDLPVYDSRGVVISYTEINNITAINASVTATGDVGTLTGYSSGHPAGDAIELQAETVSAGNGGDVYLSLGSPSTLTSLTAATDHSIAVKENMGNVTLGTLSAAGTGKVTIDASYNSSGAILDGNDSTNNITTTTLALYGKGGIGASNAIETTATNITAIVTDSGKGIGIASSGTVTSIAATVNDGEVSITDTNGSLTYGTLASGSRPLNASNLGESGGTIAFENTGIYAVQVVEVNAGSGTASIKATGAITDDGTDTTKLTALTATLTAGTSIGSSSASYQIDTSVNTLTATAAAGGIYVGNDKALTLTATATGSSSPINVTSAGAMTLNAITAPGAVTLTAYGSSTYYAITDGNDSSPNIFNNISALSATLVGASIGESGNKIEMALSGATG
jgi:trimeric autotransporter adhesin